MGLLDRRLGGDRREDVVGTPATGTPATPSAAPDRRARHRPRRLLVVTVLLTSATAGCGHPGVPGRAPDVTGVVRDSAEGPVLADPSDDYFDRMSLVRGDPVVVRRGDGEQIPVHDLRDGDDVEVWIGDGCAESSPVQCTVVALRVG